MSRGLRAEASRIHVGCVGKFAVLDVVPGKDAVSEALPMALVGSCRNRHRHRSLALLASFLASAFLSAAVGASARSCKVFRPASRRSGTRVCSSAYKARASASIRGLR